MNRDDDLLRYLGVTLDLTYKIRPVTQPPTTPATPTTPPLDDYGAWIDPDECLIHGHEPIPASCYRLCGECYHCYPTPDDLRAAYRRELWLMTEFDPVDPMIVPPVEDITFCQECTHDF